MINFESFNWSEIFGTAVAAEGMKRAQARGMRTEAIELSIAKHSDGQLKYVGMNDTLGHDFVAKDGKKWECKCKHGMFNKRVPNTSDIILKNHAGKKKDNLDQKFDYILLIDTESMTAAYAPYSSVLKKLKVNDSNMTTRIHYNDIEWVCRSVVPKDKPDLAKAFNTFLEEFV